MTASMADRSQPAGSLAGVQSCIAATAHSSNVDQACQHFSGLAISVVSFSYACSMMRFPQRLIERQLAGSVRHLFGRVTNETCGAVINKIWKGEIVFRDDDGSGSIGFWHDAAVAFPAPARLVQNAVYRLIELSNGDFTRQPCLPIKPRRCRPCSTISVRTVAQDEDFNWTWRADLTEHSPHVGRKLIRVVAGDSPHCKMSVRLLITELDGLAAIAGVEKRPIAAECFNGPVLLESVAASTRAGSGRRIQTNRSSGSVSPRVPSRTATSCS